MSEFRTSDTIAILSNHLDTRHIYKMYDVFDELPQNITDDELDKIDIKFIYVDLLQNGLNTPNNYPNGRIRHVNLYNYIEHKLQNVSDDQLDINILEILGRE